MKKTVTTIACMVLGAYSAALAETVWTENFTDVADWSVIYDPGKGSTITTDGNLGSFTVKAGGSEAAFVPAADVAPYAPFDPAKKAQYTLTFKVEKITASVSYDIAFDQFVEPSADGFLGTIWQVHPTNGTSIATGTVVVNLGGYEFDSTAKFILPKVTVHTGYGDQTVKFDLMQIDLNP